MRALVVDDNALNRKLVRMMLESAFVEVAEADSAETSLSMIDAEEYDLILMDIRMPGMDGLAAIKLIRGRTDAKRTVPVVILSADSAYNLRADCAACGADDFLQKPVSMDELFDALGGVIAADAHREAVLA